MSFNFQPKNVHADFVEDMLFAVEGEEAQFFSFLRKTDPHTFGVYCTCGGYYAGFNERVSKGTQIMCPHCDSPLADGMRVEHPALVTADDVIYSRVSLAKYTHKK